MNEAFDAYLMLKAEEGLALRYGQKLYTAEMRKHSLGVNLAVLYWICFEALHHLRTSEIKYDICYSFCLLMFKDFPDLWGSMRPDLQETFSY